MIRVFIFAAILALSACVGKQDRLAAELSVIDRFIEPKLKLDSIPDTLSRKMHEFAAAFPQNPKSEKYLYVATMLSEKAGRVFECAKWCEEYLKLYPKGQFRMKAMLAAATNYERSGSLDKAMEFYEMIVKTYPEEPVTKDVQQTIKMLKMGLVTPGQQFEYIIRQKDSAEANQ